jgi:hypothetical protein
MIADFEVTLDRTLINRLWYSKDGRVLDVFVKHEGIKFRK